MVTPKSPTIKVFLHSGITSFGVNTLQRSHENWCLNLFSYRLILLLICNSVVSNLELHFSNGDGLSDIQRYVSIIIKF